MNEMRPAGDRRVGGFFSTALNFAPWPSPPMPREEDDAACLP